jgi:ferritin-like metal-binding protein YciE
MTDRQLQTIRSLNHKTLTTEMNMKLDTLDTLMTEELRDVYDAEKQITKALPKLAKAAHSPELKEALQEHLEVTKGQIARLEEIFGLLDEKPKSKPCAGMKGLLEEGSQILEETDKRASDGNLMDAAIIAAAQRVEHYEISAYGTLRTHAERLGNDRVAQLLEQTKEEEAEADRKLTEISEQILQSAHNGFEEEEDEEIEEEDGSERRMTAGNGRKSSASQPSSSTRSRRR